MNRRRPLALLAAVALATPAFAADDAVDFKALLRDLTDLRQLEVFPSPPFVARQSSSYDRASKSPGNEAWFANGDQGQFVRTEKHGDRAEFVMMDAQGPGAITRIWSADPKGTIRVYLDGSETPTIEANMQDLLGGKVAGLPDPIACERAEGFNLYLPIPYARSCKVTGDQQKFYYHVDYRAYPKDAAVRTFAMDDVRANRDAIRAAAAALAKPTASDDGDLAKAALDLAPGKTATLLGRDGAGAIVDLELRPAKALSPEALRAIVVTMTFDGERCVEAPLGDFFAGGASGDAFEALPLAIADGQRMASRWRMPFARSARVELTNRGAEPAQLAATFRTSDQPWTDRTMHFHAGFRARHDLPTRPRSDMNLLNVEGRGTFVGVALTIDNPTKGWWGEGDEKFYVDGEPFPSWFGTGSEDYFGYAWCSPKLYTHAFHAQPRCDGPGNYGRSTESRFHVIDRVPFERSFKFDIEMWHWVDCKVNVDTVAYWYAMPGGKDDFAPLSDADLKVYPMPPYVAPHIAGAIEGESLTFTPPASGRATTQEWDGLSGERHLWWHDGPRTGDALAVRFPAPRAGRYRVLARFLSAPDYGRFTLAINGNPAGPKVLDLYHADVAPTKEIDLGTFDLRAGANDLAVTAAGRSEAARPGGFFGLDYLRLEPK